MVFNVEGVSWGPRLSIIQVCLIYLGYFKEKLTHSFLADISYYTNLTLGGSSYTVLIDTGSSDLWVAGSVPGSNDTGKTTGVSYAVGAVEGLSPKNTPNHITQLNTITGPIKTALLDFTGYTVPSQAYRNKFSIPSKRRVI